MSPPRAEALTNSEVEAVVRTVLQRLRSSVHAESAPGVAVAAALRLDQRLVALEHLRDHWNGLRTLQVPATCVVTPAVLDELRQRGVALERFTEASGNSTRTSSATAAKLLVLAPRHQHAGLARQLSGSQTQLQWFEEDSLALVLADLRQHLASGQRYALWCTPRPFAAITQIASQLALPVVQLPVLEDLPSAIEQAHPRLIVVDSARWHTAAISQLARNWNRSFAAS